LSLKHLGKQSIAFAKPPSINGYACVVGKKEGEGPLKDSFDYIGDDAYFGMETWEKAEVAMQKQALTLALNKAAVSPSKLEYIFAGDLLNQCIGSCYSVRDSDSGFFGLFGACSTMAESLSLAAMSIDGGFADIVAAVTSSHFCSAERQFRFPLDSPDLVRHLDEYPVLLPVRRPDSHVHGLGHIVRLPIVASQVHIDDLRTLRKCREDQLLSEWPHWLLQCPLSSGEVVLVIGYRQMLRKIIR
jgi:hypothetical protein